MWKPGICANICLSKNVEVKVAWKRRNKTSRSGAISFLTSKDLLQHLMTLDPAYPQNPRSLHFYFSPRLSESHIYGPCLITVSTWFFTPLCWNVSFLLIIHDVQGCFPLCECNKHPRNAFLPLQKSWRISHIKVSNKHVLLDVPFCEYEVQICFIMSPLSNILYQWAMAESGALHFMHCGEMNIQIWCCPLGSPLLHSHLLPFTAYHTTNQPSMVLYLILCVTSSNWDSQLIVT